MPKVRATTTAVIDATPQKVYSIIADYRNGHPHILPKKYFLGLEVEQGGTGAGTVIRFQMRTMGATRTFRADSCTMRPANRKRNYHVFGLPLMEVYYAVCRGLASVAREGRTHPGQPADLPQAGKPRGRWRCTGAMLRKRTPRSRKN